MPSYEQEQDERSQITCIGIVMTRNYIGTYSRVRVVFCTDFTSLLDFALVSEKGPRLGVNFKERSLSPKPFWVRIL